MPAQYTTVAKQAYWNKVKIAQSDEVIEYEGNYYFPFDSIVRSRIRRSNTFILVPEKGGIAKHLHIVVRGKVNEDAAWFFPLIKSELHFIKGMVTFQRGVRFFDIPESNQPKDTLETDIPNAK